MINIVTHNLRNGLWDIPLANKATTLTTAPLNANEASTTYHQDFKADLFVFLHAIAFSPTVATWCVAIDAVSPPTWPGLTAVAVR